MDFQRAQEIVNSPNHIQVLHQDKSVWIKSLNSQAQTAEVTSGPQFEDKMTVPVNELEEVHNKH